MKLIFLDIDGVLVTRQLGVFDQGLLRNLKHAVDETGASIVLSSDWRRHPSARAEARRELRRAGMDFISHTPCLSQFVPQRPTEIMSWRREHPQGGPRGRPDPWVAIDDRPLLQERHGNYLRGHFVQTHPLQGLTRQAADDVIKILNQDDDLPSKMSCASPLATTMPERFLSDTDSANYHRVPNIHAVGTEFSESLSGRHRVAGRASLPLSRPNSGLEAVGHIGPRLSVVDPEEISRALSPCSNLASTSRPRGNSAAATVGRRRY
jgi:hypothetical protein